MNPAAAAGDTFVGRYRLDAPLGRGAQATVWRAHDLRLQRDVALKLMAADAATTAAQPWLHEARAVSRLTHPHIVPVFDADLAQGQAYMVFELVDGPTLAQLLRQRGRLPAREAVALMLGVLDALAAAHAQGIVHRDLKPGNILVDAQGRARVMDFGIAAQVGTRADGSIVGTPSYLSPEAAAGAAPVPAMDVFASGVMLAELLAGAPPLRERDPWRAVERVLTEDQRLDPAAPVDEALRAIVQRALARDAQQRWPSAQALRDALAAWLQPGAAGEAAADGASTLEFLLRRMRHKSDFPALSDAMARIHQVAGSEKESLHRLAEEIQKDVALTNKLLRLVNSAHFRHAGGGSITTVSRAVALVGFAGIRNLSLSLVLLDHMQDKAHAQRLREQFLHALLAGHLAQQLAGDTRQGEEAFLGALLRRLGALLVAYYFPDEAQALRELQQPLPGRPALSAAQAAQQVLGLPLDALGQGVARAWGLPELLQRCMRDDGSAPPRQPLPAGPERQRWLAMLANEVADAVLLHDGEALNGALAALAAGPGRAVDVGPQALAQALGHARGQLADMVRTLGLGLGSASPARRLLAQVPGVATDTVPPATQPATQPVTSPHTLSEGIQAITDALADEGFKLDRVLRMVLDTIWRGLAFRRVVFCLRDAQGQALVGRLGLGEQGNAAARAFRVALKAEPQADLFAAVCRQGADMLISDALAPLIAPRLPAWFRGEVAAPCFVLLPLAIKGAPLGLIYADRAQAGALALPDREMALLRTLRNQAVMAFRQAGH